jgi:tripartite-type tricarboxylate transporter receptor subunit TctC
MPHRRQFLARTGAALLVGAAPLVHAQDHFPDRPVKLLVTFGPGSGPDTLARAIAPEIAKQLGQSVVVDNRPAGGGNVAAMQMLQEKHDGTTVILATDSLFTINPYLMPKTSYDLNKDFVLVAPVAEASVFLVVNPSLGVSSVKELVSLVKGNPGKYTYFAPTGTPHHLLAEQFTEINDLKWVRVSYRDPQQATTEMLSGLVPIGFTSYPQVAGSIAAGKLKPLAVSTSTRLDSHPSIPALAEFYPGLEEAGWFAVYAPADAPRAAVDKLSQAVVKARGSAELKQRLDQFGMRLITADARSFTERVQREYKHRGEVISTRGIKTD